MFLATRQAILERLGDGDLVLDIGGWADPFERADWVLDVLPYETRGLYARAGWKEPGTERPERFSKETWVTRNICGRDPFPFGNDQFDFVICSHTLEDVFDPMWVCSEMNRIGRAGFIEVPSRLEEQSWGVAGAYVGRAHHHWLVDIIESNISFVFKAHDIHSSRDFYFPRRFWKQLNQDERVQEMWWDGSFTWSERWMPFKHDRHAYYSNLVRRERARRRSASHPPWKLIRR